MLNLFDNTFNKKVVTKLVGKNLKYTRAQYRDKLRIDLKNECPPMVFEKEWKTLIEDAKDNLFKKQGRQPQAGQARYNTCHIIMDNIIKLWHIMSYYHIMSYFQIIMDNIFIICNSNRKSIKRDFITL
jgi:hypothetical protein